ncbi:hypothetical protein MKK52_12485 [Methylobacterium sp. J-067]|nr:hypothetical protein [Methylobacterium sp. J-067]
MLSFRFGRGEFEVGGGTLFLSIPGIGELWFETVTNADDPRPLGWRVMDDGTLTLEVGTAQMVFSPCRDPIPTSAA